MQKRLHATSMVLGIFPTIHPDPHGDGILSRAYAHLVGIEYHILGHCTDLDQPSYLQADASIWLVGKTLAGVTTHLPCADVLATRVGDGLSTC